jgi:AcrR family transcriptional regulator
VSTPPSAPVAPADTRARILEVAWRLLAERGPAEVTMRDVARAAGVSRQTVYVQFGSRAGLMVAMVRHRDATHPDRPALVRAREVDDPLAALEALVTSLARRWPEYHPIPQALQAAALHDADARSAWDDRMANMLALARAVTERLAAAGCLTDGWTPAAAADWLWSHVHPQGWVQLVRERGWPQADYERRLLAVARAALVRGG